MNLRSWSEIPFVLVFIFFWGEGSLETDCLLFCSFSYIEKNGKGEATSTFTSPPSPSKFRRPCNLIIQKTCHVNHDFHFWMMMIRVLFQKHKHIEGPTLPYFGIWSSNFRGHGIFEEIWDFHFLLDMAVFVFIWTK